MVLLLLQFLVIQLDEQHLLEIEFVRFSALEIEEDHIEIGGQ